MFEKLFRAKKPVVNKSFGEVSYCVAYWKATVKTKIILWNKIYDIDVCAVASNNKEFINEKQEEAYNSFQKQIIQRQIEVESIIEEYYKTKNKNVLVDKFTPKELMISKNGELALLADNADDDDIHDVPPGLAICFLPEVKLCTQEEYLSYIL